MINNLFLQSFEEMRKENDKALGHLFAGKIKANFLLDIKRRAQEQIGNDIQKYFDFSISTEKLISGMDDAATIDYEICKYIIGVHRANLVFLSEEERLLKEKDSDYRKQLTETVVKHIKLRPYAGVLFRKYPIMQGENFIYFPLPYDLFAISIRMNRLLTQKQSRQYPLRSLYIQITNKGLAALSMLEDNFLDNAYPICRGALELYNKMLLLLNVPQVIDTFFKFSEYELRQSCCEQTYLDKFNESFYNRLRQNERNKIEYLHFGWVDEIEDYHKIVKQKPYSTNGIITYLRNRYTDADKGFFDNIETLYKKCHGYTHGNVNTSKYPLLHYFEISIMLYYVLSHTYKIICDQYSVQTYIEDVDIITKIDKDFEQVIAQYSQRNTEKFEAYYKRKL